MTSVSIHRLNNRSGSFIDGFLWHTLMSHSVHGFVPGAVAVAALIAPLGAVPAPHPLLRAAHPCSCGAPAAVAPTTATEETDQDGEEHDGTENNSHDHKGIV